MTSPPNLRLVARSGNQTCERAGLFDNAPRRTRQHRVTLSHELTEGRLVSAAFFGEAPERRRGPCD